jgi:hypothetical protein
MTMAAYKGPQHLREQAAAREISAPHVIQLADYAAWDDFAENNAEALIAEYGSVDTALQHALEGGLTLGGGAAPEFLVCFEDRP